MTIYRQLYVSNNCEFVNDLSGIGIGSVWFGYQTGLRLAPHGRPPPPHCNRTDPHNGVRIYIACAVYCTVHSPRGSDIRACASLVGQSLSKHDETVSEKAAFYDD